MPIASAPTTMEELDFRSYETNKTHSFGQKARGDHGEVFRYFANSTAAATVKGNLLQSPAQDTNFNRLAVAAAQAVGDRQITLTLAGTAVTANMFNEGYLVINTLTTGLGQTFSIISHTVQTSTTGAVTFTVMEPVNFALTTSATASVRINPWNGCIQAPTTLTGTVTGVSNYIVPISTSTVTYYGWLQTRGPAAVLMNDTSTVGTAIMNGGAAGACIAYVVGAGKSIVGEMMQVGVSGDTSMVNLRID